MMRRHPGCGAQWLAGTASRTLAVVPHVSGIRPASNAAQCAAILGQLASGPYDKEAVRRMAHEIVKDVDKVPAKYLFGHIKSYTMESCSRSDGFRKVICAARSPAAKKAFAVKIHDQLKNNSWSLAEYAENRTFCGVPVLRHDCDDVMGERHLDAGIVNRNIVTKVAAALKSASNSALPIIAGESGSGKTVAAILSGAKWHR